MKLPRFSVFFGLAFLAVLAGCTQQDEGEQEVMAPAVEEATTVVAQAETAADPRPVRYVEYMWCDFGEEMSADTWALLKADWNVAVATLDNKPLIVNGMAPQFESENYDGVWAQVWDSKETRDSAWAEWNEKHDAAFNERWKNVLLCDPEKNFPFEAQAGYLPTAQWTTEPPFVTMYSFCTINEGFTMEDVAAEGAKGTAWLTEREAEDGSTGYWNAMHTPLFDTNTNGTAAGGWDFLMGHYWPSGESMASGMEAYSATELPAQRDKVFTCENFNFEFDPVLAQND